MKTKIVILSTLLFLSVTTYAQSYRPTEQKVEIGKITTDAWVIAVADEPLDVLKESWADYVRQTLDVKVKKGGKNELVAREIRVPTIYDHTGDLKAKFFTEQKQSTVAVAFMPGYDISLNTRTNPVEAENLRRFTKNFVKYYHTNRLNALIAVQEKREKSLKSAYERSERERKQLTKRVAKREKRMNAAKTSASEKFAMNNEQIADESRISALEAIMTNHRRELTQINRIIQQHRAEISHLETLFAEPLAEKESSRGKR